MTLGQADAGKAITLTTGQILEVTLEGNPSTGYTWELEKADLKALRLEGEPQFTAANKNVVGGSGTLTLRFTAVAAGQEALKLVYHRSWEVGVDPLKTYAVTIVVK